MKNHDVIEEMYENCVFASNYKITLELVEKLAEAYDMTIILDNDSHNHTVLGIKELYQERGVTEFDIVYGAAYGYRISLCSSCETRVIELKQYSTAPFVDCVAIMNTILDMYQDYTGVSY